jgi:lipoate-protein ligase A
LGRFQTREEAVVPSFQRVVSRTTGGKAVLHGHDQTVGLALPFTSGSVKEAYCAAIRPLIRALNLCGADCGLVTETANERGNSPDCFATASAYDLVHQPTGRKLAGVAMRINRSALLLQASIPYREPLIEPSLAIVDAAQVKLAPWDWRSFPEALGEFFFQELAA